MVFSISKFAGWLLVLSLLVSIINAFNHALPVVIAGWMTLIAAMLLFPRLISVQKVQIFFLLLIGVLLILLSGQLSFELLTKALTQNHAVVAIVISVSFLRLIVKPGHERESLPEGMQALWKTLCGVFAFAAVINMSAIAIFGDRLSNREKLSQSQVMILTRMFGANALWSPFFVSMGAALINSGGAELSTLLIAGLSLAMCSLVLTGIQSQQSDKLDGLTFKGYPMHLDSLYLPALLSILVVIAQFIFEDVSILILVSMVVVVTVLCILFLHQPTQAVQKVRNHINETISISASEVALFFSAGILAVGITSFVLSVDYQLPIDTFNGYSAAITLVLMIALSLLGVHPIVSISVVGGILAPLSPDPNLLGIMFIFSWGLSVPLSSFSAISLMMQSRYQIAALDLFKTNLGFTLLMLVPASLVLIYYGNQATA